MRIKKEKNVCSNQHIVQLKNLRHNKWKDIIEQCDLILYYYFEEQFNLIKPFQNHIEIHTSNVLITPQKCATVLKLGVNKERKEHSF